MSGAFDLAAALAERSGGRVVDAVNAVSNEHDVVVGEATHIEAHRGRALFAVARTEVSDPAAGWAPWFTGSVKENEGRVTVSVWSRHGPPMDLVNPVTGRCMAIIAAYNEVDVLEAVVERLVAQDVEVYVIDNWSTDGTFDLGVDLEARGLLAGLERFPDTPTQHSSWAALLTRKAAVAVEQDVRWAIHNDADETRMSPWPDVNLRQGLSIVDRLGYTAVDFTMVEHPPVANVDPDGGDVLDAMPWYRFGLRPGNFVQVKAWCAPRTIVKMGAGHNIRFPGRKVFPFNFVLHHYPIRSTEHGRRKALIERRERFDPSEIERGWHSHYNHVTNDTDFFENSADLDFFDPAAFLADRMGETVARVGLTPTS